MKFLWLCLIASLPLLAENCHEVSPAYAYAKLQTDDTAGPWHKDAYWPMLAMESSEEGIHLIGSWLASNTAPTPIYPPVQGNDIEISAGWRYTDPEEPHYGIDYAHVNGETFPVYAVADGTVLWVGYHTGPGNVVIIEHKPLEGYTFRTIYHHLRNGRDHDVDQALRTQAFVKQNPGYSWDHWARRYQANGEKAASALSRGDQQTWLEETFGTPEQKILVKEGQRVRAGQQIGWAGSTGIHCENTHLHFMIARPASWVRKGIAEKGDVRGEMRWTLFDPYGIYSQDVKTYQLDASPQKHHPSLFAPTRQDFVQLDVPTYNQALNYFSRFNYYPRALCIYQDPKSLVNTLSGSFEPATERPPFHLLTSFEEHQREILDCQKAGWQPQKILVTGRPHGPSLYTTLFTATDKKAWFSKTRMPSNTFGAEFGDAYTKKFTLVDFCPYYERNQLHFSAIWEKPTQWHNHSVSWDLTQEELILRNEKFQEKKLFPTVIHKYRSPKGTVLWAALWSYVQPDEEVSYKLNLPVKEFTSHHKKMLDEAFTLEHISVLDDSIAVVYKRSKPPYPAPMNDSAPEGVSLWDFLALNRLRDDHANLYVRGERMPMVQDEEPASEPTPVPEEPIPAFLDAEPIPLFTPEAPPEMPPLSPLQLEVEQEAPQAFPLQEKLDK